MLRCHCGGDLGRSLVFGSKFGRTGHQPFSVDIHRQLSLYSAHPCFDSIFKDRRRAPVQVAELHLECFDFVESLPPSASLQYCQLQSCCYRGATQSSGPEDKHLLTHVGVGQTSDSSSEISAQTSAWKQPVDVQLRHAAFMVYFFPAQQSLPTVEFAGDLYAAF